MTSGQGKEATDFTGDREIPRLEVNAGPSFIMIHEGDTINLTSYTFLHSGVFIMQSYNEHKSGITAIDITSP